MSDPKTVPPLRVGVIGLGIAGAAMVPALCDHPRAVLAGAADVNAELRRRFTSDKGLPAVDNALDLIGRDEVDAVYIATPHQFHLEHAVEAARRGKHIIVEKPMALSLDDCDVMEQEARRNNVVMIVGHTHGFDLPVLRMRQATTSGEYGRLSMLSMWNYTNFLYRPRREEELDTSKGGGVLFNQLPHQVDVARTIADSPVRSVRASTAILDPRRPTEGSYTVFIDFESGVTASLVYSGYDHFDSDELHQWISSSGKPKKPQHGKARKAWEGLADAKDELELRQREYGYGGAFLAGESRYQPHFGLMVVSCQNADLKIAPDGIAVYSDEGMTTLPLVGGQDGRTNVIDELCAAVLDDVRPLHDGAFARETLRVCLAVHESARQRREISIADLQRRHVSQ
ncbi:Gfo/Idh/MocA family protein [Pigmentiphaga kullae]|uniref:Phthalate 4,5-cis-dihydrodiol dehydrogenase n=1 Tax=Pigmentiphaga kullae TaxID=151784 RepID=A0A4Q7NNT2_9BURK|nr:Gfo/Idh/MocA family oxidoreductase [Pigmentiphaga kullae]RZS86606.1 phthalate 4,5-cis-dihydrodiol dehydrogenase [Pigmentiphaga kullae]